jgi:hypothetical protein
VRRSSLLLGLAVIAAFAGVAMFLYRHVQHQRDWRGLLELEGQEIARDVHLAERAAGFLDRHLGVTSNFPTWPGSAPFFVVSAEDCILVFQCLTENHLNAEPAPEGVLFVFDRDGRLKNSENFSFGWSLFPGVPRMSKDPVLQREVLEFPCSGKGPVARQFFVLRGTHLDLVRLENTSGAVLPNRYDGRSVGSWIGETRVRQFEVDLGSSDPCDVLAALVWLGGTHWKPGEAPPSRPVSEQFLTAQAARLRRDEKVRARIDQLTRSDHPWIREAAVLAQSALAPAEK